MPSENRLLPVIQEEIRACGPISFAHFMELCLYHPEHGYYSSDRIRLGAAGDFYTSAHITPVFARILARYWQGLWTTLGKPERFDLVELGPGDGLLARELLSWVSQRFPEFFSCLRYLGVEQSGTLRNRLEQRLQCFGDKARTVADLLISAPGANGGGFQGCIFANEFFDALPVHLLTWRESRWRERYVSLDGEQLIWTEGKPSSVDLEREAELRFHPALPLPEREEGWVAEVSPRAGQWMKKIGQCLLRGQALVIDYGYTLGEWQGGRFPEGSALAYRRHRAIADLLFHPGDQDITAHANFSQLREAGKQAGLGMRGLESQAKFLLEIGRPDEFQDVFADCGSEGERLRRSRLLKTLILPQGMGETFRVLVLEKAL